jgi:hypothetical protein
MPYVKMIFIVFFSVLFSASNREGRYVGIICFCVLVIVIYACLILLFYFQIFHA